MVDVVSKCKDGFHEDQLYPEAQIFEKHSFLL